MSDRPTSSDNGDRDRLTATSLTAAAREAIPGEYQALPASIGDYRILALLGEGGMGTVYKAEQKTQTASWR